MPLADQFFFNDEQFLSAQEKRLILRSWLLFLRHGCRLEHFSERLYHHLALHCSYIAHFNRRGFYEYYFADPSERTARFLDQFDPGKPGISAEMGATYWLMERAVGADLNHAMREAAGPYITKLRYQFADIERQADLALAARLAEKHGKRLSDSHSSPAVDTSSWRSAGARLEQNSSEQLTIFSPAD